MHIFVLRNFFITLFLSMIPVISFSDEARHHASIDMTGGVYGLSPTNKNANTSLGYMFSPEINYSIPCKLAFPCKKKGSRYFFSFMWTGVEALAAGGATDDGGNASSEAKPVNTQEYNVMTGISFDIDLTGGTVSSAADKFFFGLGYGNVLIENGAVLEGVTIMAGFKLTVLGFDLVK